MAEFIEVTVGTQGALVLQDGRVDRLPVLLTALTWAIRVRPDLDRVMIIGASIAGRAVADNDVGLIERLARDFAVRSVVVVGLADDQVLPSLPPVKLFRIAGVEDLLQQLEPHHLSKSLCILLGLTSTDLAFLSKPLALPVRKSTLEINLSALGRNIAFFRRHVLLPQTQLMVMAKADAYGGGASKIAVYLELCGVDYLSVAFVEEGVDLRRACVALPIMVLSTAAEELSDCMEYRLEPVSFDKDHLRKLVAYCKHEACDLVIHLEVETGMQRLGFGTGDAEAIADILSTTTRVRVGSIFSHLSASEDPVHDDFTQLQCNRFLDTAERISRLLGYRPKLHIANSNAVLRNAKTQLDLVRLGIGIYGVGMPGYPELEATHVWKSTITQIKHVPVGETIGYGRMERVEGDMKIAIIPTGYADGLIRKAGQRRYAGRIFGRLAPIVGHTCMDMTMLDISGMTEVQQGSEVRLLDREQTADQLACAVDSIPHEVLSSIGRRVERVYVF